MSKERVIVLWGIALAAALILGFKAYVILSERAASEAGAKSEAVAEKPRAAIADRPPTQPVKPVAPAPEKHPDVRKADLVGWWSEGGFCEGDAGFWFEADGTWGRWAVEGTWTLNGRQLTLREETRVRDTASGDPEPIKPPNIVRASVKGNGDKLSIRLPGSDEAALKCEEE